MTERVPYILHEHRITYDNVIDSLMLYDCFKIEFWREVAFLFGNDLLKDETYNQKITAKIKSAFYFGVRNGMIFDMQHKSGAGYYMMYDVEDNKTKFLQISYDGEILWELKI